MIKLIVGLIVVGALAYFGSPDAALDELIARVAILAAIGLLLIPIVYLWKVAATPAKMDHALEDRIPVSLPERTLKSESKNAIHTSGVCVQGSVIPIDFLSNLRPNAVIFTPGKNYITLDGEFTVAQLEEIIAFLRAHPPTTP